MTPRRPPAADERPPSSAFDALPGPVRTGAERLLVRRSLAPGELLFQEGDPPRAAFAVRGGLLKAVKMSPGDRGAVLHVIRPGRLCGAVALLDRRPYPVSVYAIDRAEVAVVPLSLFDAWMKSHDAFARAVHAELGDGLRHAQRMRALAGSPAAVRLAYLLALLQPEGAPDIRLRREDLADLAGCIPETAIRVLSGFRRRGWVRTGWRRVGIRDRRALEELFRGADALF